jgi:murein L,D-transpeptidase YcbB/YkuD
MPQPRRYTDQAARQRAYRTCLTQARHQEQEVKGLPAAAALSSLPSRARWQALLTQARHALQTAAEEMQAYYDDRSPAWQDGERAAALQEQLDALAQVLEDLDAVPP